MDYPTYSFRLQITPTPFYFLLECSVLHNLPPNTNHILNFSINSFCPLDTALVLTSDNLHVTFPPSPPPFLSCIHPGGTYLKLAWCHLYHEFTYIYSLLIEKDICDRWCVSVKLPCVCVSFVWRCLHFLSKSFFFLLLFLCYPYFPSPSGLWIIIYLILTNVNQFTPWITKINLPILLSLFPYYKNVIRPFYKHSNLSDVNLMGQYANYLLFNLTFILHMYVQWHEK